MVEYEGRGLPPSAAWVLSLTSAYQVTLFYQKMIVWFVTVTDRELVVEGRGQSGRHDEHRSCLIMFAMFVPGYWVMCNDHVVQRVQ